MNQRLRIEAADQDQGRQHDDFIAFPNPDLDPARRRVLRSRHHPDITLPDPNPLTPPRTATEFLSCRGRNKRRASWPTGAIAGEVPAAAIEKAPSGRGPRPGAAGVTRGPGAEAPAMGAMCNSAVPNVACSNRSLTQQ